MDVEDYAQAFGLVIAAIVILFVVAVLLAFPTMWLWNWLMPVLFKLPEVTVWQALGLNLLSGLLLKSTTTIKKD